MVTSVETSAGLWFENESDPWTFENVHRELGKMERRLQRLIKTAPEHVQTHIMVVGHLCHVLQAVELARFECEEDLGDERL